MAGLRDSSRGLAALALIAMMLQIIGAFGHSHFASVGGLQAREAVTVAKAALSDVAVVVDDAASDRAPSGDGDTFCAVCLAGHFVATAQIASPPLLVLPVAYVLLGPPHVATMLPRASRAAAFRSRGPPLS